MSESFFGTMESRMDTTNNYLQALEQCHRTGMAGVQKKEGSSWHRHDASADGVTQNTPSTGTCTLYPKPIEDQQGTHHREEERDPVPAFRHDPCDHKM